tara:strand:- start:16 stop:456 length:441 start_codon:yes stop_codon:yes gene_type:complete
MKKTRYVSDGYVDKITNLIYNDRPIQPYIDEINPPDKFNKEVVKEILLRGEKYVQLDADRSHIVLTSFGRIINTHLIRQLSPLMSVKGMHIYAIDRNVRIKKIFKEQEWEFDITAIKKRYIKYKWKWNVMGKKADGRVIRRPFVIE